MAKKKNSFLLIAVALVALGLAEDVTGILLIVGVLTSLSGVALYYFKVLRRKRR